MWHGLGYSERFSHSLDPVAAGWTVQLHLVQLVGLSLQWLLTLQAAEMFLVPCQSLAFYVVF